MELKCSGMVQYFSKEDGENCIENCFLSPEAKEKHKVVKCPFCNLYHIIQNHDVIFE